MTTKKQSVNPKALFILVSLFFLCSTALNAQAVPNPEENIEYLVTFGKEAPGTWGDDDHCQIFFFTLPTSYSKPLYIRVFDPDVGGAHDEIKGEFNTKTKFSIFGGKGTYTHPDAQRLDPIGKYDSGFILDSKTFAVSDKYDGKWYSFGPFNPQQGELYSGFGGDKYIFKVIAQGISGDDGNLYHYFFSESPNKNIPIEGAEPFTFEYTFRVPVGVSHIYPFVDERVTAVQIHNYDFDMDGSLRLVSVKRKSEPIKTSNDGQWTESYHKIYEEEKGTTLDIQTSSLSKKDNNNIVFYITNQYGESMPFFTNPIGLENMVKIIANKKR